MNSLLERASNVLDLMSGTLFVIRRIYGVCRPLDSFGFEIPRDLRYAWLESDGCSVYHTWSDKVGFSTIGIGVLSRYFEVVEICE